MKLKHDGSLSSFAFSFKLRQYTEEALASPDLAETLMHHVVEG